MKNKTCLSFKGRTALCDLSVLSEVALSMGKALFLTGSHWMTTLLKFMGRVCAGSVCFVFSHKSCWKLRFISSVATVILLRQSRGTCSGVCKVSVTGRRQHPSALPVTINKRSKMHTLLSHCYHDTAVRWTEASFDPGRDIAIRCCRCKQKQFVAGDINKWEDLERKCFHL